MKLDWLNPFKKTLEKQTMQIPNQFKITGTGTQYVLTGNKKNGGQWGKQKILVIQGGRQFYLSYWFNPEKEEALSNTKNYEFDAQFTRQVDGKSGYSYVEVNLSNPREVA